jgi:hypothetical protein
MFRNTTGSNEQKGPLAGIKENHSTERLIERGPVPPAEQERTKKPEPFATAPAYLSRPGPPGVRDGLEGLRHTPGSIIAGNIEFRCRLF